MRRLLLSALSINALSFTALGAGVALTLPAAPAAAQQWREITCESWNYREAVCPAPGAVRVQLLRVRGGSCIEGQTWYHDDRAIRVRNGCRATFRIDANKGWGVGGWDPNQGVGNGIGGGRWQVVRCESWNYRAARCPIGGARSVSLTRVIAGNCQEGRTWGWDRNSIWVNGGCRATFTLY